MPFASAASKMKKQSAVGVTTFSLALVDNAGQREVERRNLAKLKKSALNCHTGEPDAVHAAYLLGIGHLYGVKLPRDLDTAVSYFAEALDFSPGAALNLGLMAARKELPADRTRLADWPGIIAGASTLKTYALINQLEPSLVADAEKEHLLLALAFFSYAVATAQKNEDQTLIATHAYIALIDLCEEFYEQLLTSNLSFVASLKQQALRWMGRGRSQKTKLTDAQHELLQHMTFLYLSAEATTHGELSKTLVQWFSLKFSLRHSLAVTRGDFDRLCDQLRTLRSHIPEASFLLYQLTLQTDQEEALDHLLDAGERGSREAQHRLGMATLDGLIAGGAQEAIAWLNRSATQGYADSITALAELYAGIGKFIDPQPTQVSRWGARAVILKLRTNEQIFDLFRRADPSRCLLWFNEDFLPRVKTGDQEFFKVVSLTRNDLNLKTAKMIGS